MNPRLEVALAFACAMFSCSDARRAPPSGNLSAGTWTVEALQTVEGTAPALAPTIREVAIDADGVAAFGPFATRTDLDVLATAYAGQGALREFARAAADRQASVAWFWTPALGWDPWQAFALEIILERDPSQARATIRLEGDQTALWRAVATLRRR